MRTDEPISEREFAGLWAWLIGLYPYTGAANCAAYHGYLSKLPRAAVIAAMREAPDRYRQRFPTAGDLKALALEHVKAKHQHEAVSSMRDGMDEGQIERNVRRVRDLVRMLGEKVGA